jgi:hypothetical protein
MEVPAKAAATETENLAAQTSQPLPYQDQDHTALGKEDKATEAVRDSEMALGKER